MDLEKKFDEVKKTTNQTAKKVEEQWKKLFSWVGIWWNNASDEEKVYMILWIILLIIWLLVSWDAIKGLILIVIWIFFITGFFVSKKK
jgi:uncharacterized membrane protein YkvA (DUF1232 family)